MKIRIELELDDEYVDPDHDLGITEEAYDDLFDAVSRFGYDVEIKSIG